MVLSCILTPNLLGNKVSSRDCKQRITLEDLGSREGPEKREGKDVRPEVKVIREPKA